MLHVDLDRYLSLAVPLIVACGARPLSERLPPRAATWLLTLTSLLLSVAGLATLGVLAAGGVIRIPEVAAVGHLSLRIIRHSGDTSLPVAMLAGLAFLAATASVVWTALRQARAFRAAAATARELPGDSGVAVLDDAVPDAFAIPGRPGRIVVSTGMLDLLDAAERRALLAHEHAHLDHRHHWFRTAAFMAAAANPLLRPVRKAVIFTTERWADEDAAALTGDRTVAARAIGKAALAGRRRPKERGLAATLLGIGGAAPGPVPRRVAALLAPPRGTRVATICSVAALALVLISAVSVQGEASDLEAIVHHAHNTAVSAHR